MPDFPTSTLHSLNKTTADLSLNTRLSQAISKGDEVILIEDGVYQCLNLFSGTSEINKTAWPQLAKAIYALKDDAVARGIPTSTENIIFVDYEAFVKLSLSHKKVISWY